MYTHAQRVKEPEVQELRKAAGALLKSLREQQRLSQRQLAELVGVEYYTFISQLETGRGRIPPDRSEIWAEALGVDVRLFTKAMVFYYDPITYRHLFGDEVPELTVPLAQP
jgi:transcriptional regulator with XRE-family HTH domain